MEMLEVDGMRIPSTVFSPGDRVKWNHSNPNGWAGPGIARVRAYDPARAYFGPPVGSGKPGPAYEIELEHNGLRQWLEPAVLDAFPEEEEITTSRRPGA